MTNLKKLLTITRHGNLTELQKFINSNYEDLSWITHSTKSGDSVPLVAARYGHLEILQYVKDEIGLVNLARHSNFDGKTVLHEAAHFGHIDCVNFLTENRFPLDPIKRADWTPLMLACTRSSLEVICLLVEHGANMNLVNKDGWNCFHIACREGNENIVNYLLNKDNNLWNTVSKNGRTPLHTAALHGCLNVVKLLLGRCGYEVDIRDKCGVTPLMDASRGCCVELIQLLLSSQAQLCAEDKLGRGCLHIAAEAGHVEVILYLVEKCGVDVNSVTLDGQTALHLAVKEGHSLLASELLSLGCVLNNSDHKQRTALHFASGGQHAECVRLLLEHGATDEPDVDGVKAESLARNLDVCNIFAGT